MIAVGAFGEAGPQTARVDVDLLKLFITLFLFAKYLRGTIVRTAHPGICWWQHFPCAAAHVYKKGAKQGMFC